MSGHCRFIHSGWILGSMEKKCFSTGQIFVESMSKNSEVFHVVSATSCYKMAFFTAILVSVEKIAVIYIYFNAGCGEDLRAAFSVAFHTRQRFL